LKEVQINKGYELYQIITDFGEPLEIFREAFQNAIDENATEVFCNVFEDRKLSGNKLIIDVWNNGNGLPKEKVHCFFDLANSTKIDINKIPIKGKLGYKGHGSKIFFNSEAVQVVSKDKDHFYLVQVEKPIEQIDTHNTFHYSDFLDPALHDIPFPPDWEKGFFLRIVGHLHFRTQHTRFKLSHQHLRDYIKWFSVFGSVQPQYDETLKNKPINLFLSGLNLDAFASEYKNFEKIDPVPEITSVGKKSFEKIPFGHYFPDQRSTEKVMKEYAKKCNSNKPYYDFYSKTIFNSKVTCDNNLSFHLIVNAEGYETKRRYNKLLTGRGKSRTDISHTDSERYGVWACKGGVPVQKIDSWIEGAKGTYSFIQAFIDCDDFNLTANRGSINNSDIEKLDIVKAKLNEIFNERKIKDALNERAEIEKLENQLANIEEDGRLLKSRYSAAVKSVKIKLPNGVALKEPSKLQTGYSESETMILLTSLIQAYPHLFNFQFLDYDTRKGIDFVVEHGGNPKYIELKGTLTNYINHPFRHIYKFICYDLELPEGQIVQDIEDVKASLKVNKADKFLSFDDNFKNKQYKSYKLEPDSAQFQSMEVIYLKEFLRDFVDAKFE
jgi:hypothetical protein